MKNQKNLSSTLWDMCKTFRGTIDASKYKDYILVLLFLWTIDKQNTKEAQNNTGLKALYNYKTFKLKNNFFYEILKETNNPKFSEIIQKSIEKIEKDNPELEGIFSDINFNTDTLGQAKERNELLATLFRSFDELKVDLDEDFIGNAYQELIEKFAGDSGKSGGEFYTPDKVSILLAKLLEPKNKEKIYDPTCGSGSLLLKVKKLNNSVNLYGQEKNRQTFGICKMNLILNNDPEDLENIHHGNTLVNPRHITQGSLQKFDKIIANPPYSATLNGDFEKITNEERFLKYGLTNKGKIDFLFLEHMIATLKENGKIVTLMPLGVLERVKKEMIIRKNIIIDNLVDCIISLPSNMFYGTSIPVCIFIIQKNKKDNKVLFIDASDEFKKMGKKKILEKENIEKILTTYFNKETINEFSNYVELDEIKENNYSLSPRKYIKYKETRVEFDLTKAELEILNTTKEVSNLESEIQSTIKELKNTNE